MKLLKTWINFQNLVILLKLPIIGKNSRIKHNLYLQRIGVTFEGVSICPTHFSITGPNNRYEQPSRWQFEGSTRNHRVHKNFNLQLIISLLETSIFDKIIGSLFIRTLMQIQIISHICMLQNVLKIFEVSESFLLEMIILV